jgi:hypothetical protein
MNIKYLASAGLAIVIAAVAVVIFAGSGGNANASQPQAAASSAISIRSTSLGKTLVDANGRTLRATKPTSARSPLPVPRSGRALSLAAP